MSSGDARAASPKCRLRSEAVKPQPAENAARYLSSYFVRGSGRKMAIWESVTSGLMPMSIVHVSVQLTQETRCTMRTFRLRRALYVVWAGEFQLSEVHLVATFFELFRGNVELVPVWDDSRGACDGVQ